MKQAKNNSKLSVVIPIYNEEEILEVLFEKLNSVLEPLQLNYEIIFVDDGSVDKSLKIIKNFNHQNNQFKAISFSRNFGHQTAVSAGLEFSSGQAVVVMDGDLQDPPELIPSLMEKWQEGYQVVYAIRKKRKEKFFKKLSYKTYYRILKKMAKIDIPLDSGDFCLMDRKVVSLINSLPERTRFIRGLRSWVGFHQIGIEYERDKRFAGQPKYTFSKLLSLALDGVLSFSGAPLRAAIIFGFIVSILSFFYAIFIALVRLMGYFSEIPGWTSIIAIVTFLGGVQLIIIGFIGEYISRIFNEVKQRPLYIIEEKIGFKD